MEEKIVIPKTVFPFSTYISFILTKKTKQNKKQTNKKENSSCPKGLNDIQEESNQESLACYTQREFLQLHLLFANPLPWEAMDAPLMQHLGSYLCTMVTLRTKPLSH